MSTVDIRINVATSIVDGAARGQFVVDDVHPLGIAVVVTLHALSCLQSEILSQTGGGILRIGTATAFHRSAILHFGGHTAVAHERCHGISLRLVVLAVVIVVEHVVPVVVMLSEIGRHGLTVIVDGMCTNSMFRHLVIVQHLSHGCGHASGEAF